MTQPSLRRDLLVRLLTLLVTFSALASAVAYQLGMRFSDDAYDQWLQDSARSVAQLIQVQDGRIHVDLPPRTLKAMIWDAYDQVYFRIDDNGQMLAGQPDLRIGRPLSDGEVYFFDHYVDGHPVRAVQIYRRNLIPGHTVTITMAETLHKRQRLANRMLSTVFVLSVLLGFLTMLFVRDAVTRGLRPLLSLADTVRSRSGDNIARLPDAGMAEELRVFTSAINDLLDRLNLALQAQRRFVADAAHQLRTPLAALKMELEHAVREPDPDQRAVALVELRRGIDRVTRLSNQLLTLARAEPGALASAQFQTLDVHAVVYQAAQTMLSRAMDQGADLGFVGESDEPLWIRGDALLIEELIRNLLDNALNYAGPQARIDVQVEREGHQALVCIEDNGPGVSSDDLMHLGERFRRLPGSPAGGSGLGLAIVAEIVQAHGGQWHIENAHPHGLRVMIRLPLIQT